MAVFRPKMALFCVKFRVKKLPLFCHFSKLTQNFTIFHHFYTKKEYKLSKITSPCQKVATFQKIFDTEIDTILHENIKKKSPCNTYKGSRIVHQKRFLNHFLIFLKNFFTGPSPFTIDLQYTRIRTTPSSS